ncbi:type IV pilus secretin PilQ [Legionella micdadei]|uniref:type IV pilus secretin PilQ n=1 Tax=Legionella micdadei TaxID=451 RepID=UPI0020A4634C|nr:type IV pilus secretin PilQ [Legionella micdadei]
MSRIILILILIIGNDCLFAMDSNVNGTKLSRVNQENKQEIVQTLPMEQKSYNNKDMVKFISLNFQEIKVSAVLQLLADFTGINIVVSDKVTSSLSLRLDDILWDQALDIILTTRSLSKRKIGNVMFVAPVDEIIELEKKEFSMENDRRNFAPLRSDLLQVNYAKAADIANLLTDPKTTLLSPRGSVNVDARTNTIWLQDIGTHVKKIRELVKRLDVPVKQVLIEARIVNATKDFARDLGVRFGVSRPNHLVGRLKGIKQSVPYSGMEEEVPLAERLNLDLAALPITASPASVGVALAKLGNGILLDLELSALESEGKGEIIANPRLITTNQQTAVIESGEEIPYQEATLSGSTAVAFKKAVLSLKVTPQITPDSKILMDLQINQNIPSVKVFNGVPSILTKEIQTSVLINDGQTVVLGGIYKRDKYNALNRVPFLGELPVVGRLFRNKTTAVKNEELLIFITPRIITNNLSAVTMEGRRQAIAGGVKLGKFGKRVGSIH